MNTQRAYKTFILTGFITLLIFLADIFTGSVYIPFSQIFSILAGASDKTDPASVIILQSRLPKAITAILAGMSLPVAGLYMQTFFRNPVAGPDILGVSAGSSLFVAFVMLTAGSIFSVSAFSSISVIIAGVAGAACILLVILSVARRIGDTVTLLIFGILFGMAISAVVGLLQYYSEQGALKLFIMWTFGSLGGVTWGQLYILIPIISAILLIAFFQAKKMNMLLMGEQYAATMGLRIVQFKYIIITITAVITGAITAFCGPVAFVGIAVPHIARMLYKTNDHFILIPACMLCGAAILLICDIISQTPGAGGILPLNSITACMGAPFVLYILFRERTLNRYF